jgi:hypothetical protein
MGVRVMEPSTAPEAVVYRPKRAAKLSPWLVEKRFIMARDVADWRWVVVQRDMKTGREMGLANIVGFATEREAERERLAIVQREEDEASVIVW